MPADTPVVGVMFFDMEPWGVPVLRAHAPGTDGIIPIDSHPLDRDNFLSFSSMISLSMMTNFLLVFLIEIPPFPIDDLLGDNEDLYPIIESIL